MTRVCPQTLTTRSRGRQRCSRRPEFDSTGCTGCGARFVVPLHDAFVFEAPLEELEEVADLTEQAMSDAVRTRFTELCPRVSVNMTEPSCWNKDGRADSVERWIEDPLFTL
jgi:hypothetical protein